LRFVTAISVWLSPTPQFEQKSGDIACCGVPNISSQDDNCCPLLRSFHDPSGRRRVCRGGTCISVNFNTRSISRHPAQQRRQAPRSSSAGSARDV
jgi:hypothetical protein